MSVPSIDKDIYDLCCELVAQQLPGEADLMEDWWSAFWAVLDVDSIEEMSDAVRFDLRRTPIENLGGIGPMDAADGLFVISALCGAAALALRQRDDAELTEEQIAELVEEQATAANCPPHVRSILIERGVPLLCAYFAVASDPVAAGCRYFVSVKERSAPSMRGRWVADDKMEALEAQHYHLLLDERQPTRLLIEGEAKPMSSLGVNGSHMLWLMLVHIDASFTHSDVGMLAGYSVKTSTIPNYRKAVREVIGAELIDRWLRAGRMAYTVPAEDIAICWIRQKKDLKSSMLVRDVSWPA